MKWVLIGLVGAFGAATLAHGDTIDPNALFKQSVDALSAGQYDVASKGFDQLIANFPNALNINEMRLDAGFAYLRLGDFPSAIDRLSKEVAPETKPQYRGTGLYFTGLAQYSLGQKLADTDKAGSAQAMNQAVTTLSALIDFIAANPSDSSSRFQEDAMYYVALAQYRIGHYGESSSALRQLLDTFGTSLKRPDYSFLLGSIYAVQTSQAVDAYNDPSNKDKEKPAEITALAQKALDAFAQVSSDPNALVQANTANMSRAEVLYMIAPLEPNNDGYEKALDAFRLVRRKDDMIQLQQNHLDELKRASQAQDMTADASNDLSLLIYREQGRLDDLRNAPDPIIQALMRMAECYAALKQSDEARTVLHRLVKYAHDLLTPSQQQEVDFDILFSYVLGGQTDKADKALTEYLDNHKGDPQADSISYQIAAKLLERKDYAGALAQAERSLSDFPKGKVADYAVGIKVQALTGLGRIPESDQVVDDFLQQNPTDPVANDLLLVRAENETARGDLTTALTDYQKVRDNSSASEDLQAIAGADYIQTLRTLNRYDDILTESKNFQLKYANSPALPGVLFFAALAMDQKGDPGAVAAFQDIAVKYPASNAAASALFYVVTIYERTKNVAAMVQAADDFRKAYPKKYDFLEKITDLVGKEYEKEKKFDLAAANYQTLADVPDPEIASTASTKVGDTWLAAAKAMGAYQSLPLAKHAEAEKKLSEAEQAYVSTLKNYPNQFEALGQSFEGLANTLKLRRSWGLVTDATMEATLTNLTVGLTSPEMQTRVELAKAGLVFIYKNGTTQYLAALLRFKTTIGASPGLRLTRLEASQYGELLIAAKDYATAIQVYTDLLASSDAPLVQADGDYGLGATYLAQGDVAKAKEYFLKLKALPDGAAWHPHILDAEFGLALANEQSTQAGDSDKAKATYAQLMQEPRAGIVLQAKSMLGYGRLLEKAGFAINPAPEGANESAVHYYLQPHTFYGPALPEVSAEGLFDAGQAYEKAGNKALAQKQYNDLIRNYGTTAPDWADKAKAALGNVAN